ncbi:MAG: lipopolysaccharide assembly protein LapB [Legionellales bacterium]|nr:lipopolysaccharide assembly protein LapB [Legionellales bacterium]
MFWLKISPLFIFTLFIGWALGRKSRKRKKHTVNDSLSRDYLIGLNYLLNEQADKAVDIFIKMLQVDSDTVETHLALGHLFRRRGEVDRAIRIHQNLIARPHLSKANRVQALLALGQDYLKAGVFDRAEKLFQEVHESNEFRKDSLTYLMAIYEQEKDWHQAINTAQKVEQLTGQNLKAIIAQYYCELAIDARVKVSSEQAFRLVKRAMSIDKNCVRASILLGNWEAEQQNYKLAIKAYKRVVDQDPDFISEIIAPLELCYQKLDIIEDFIHFLRQCLLTHARISIVLTLSKFIEQSQDQQTAANFVAEHLHQRPSIYGLRRLITLQKKFSEGQARFNLQLLEDLTSQLIKDKPIYQCTSCGNTGKLLHWQCPGCKHWNTVKPIHGLEGD